MLNNVIKLPTPKNIQWHADKPFRDVKVRFERVESHLNGSRLIIYGLIISNLLSWMFLAALTNSFITHNHDVSSYISEVK